MATITLCGLVVEVRLSAGYKTVRSGGIGTEADMVTLKMTTHHKSDDRTCFHKDAASITAFWLIKDLVDLLDQTVLTWLDDKA